MVPLFRVAFVLASVACWTHATGQQSPTHRIEIGILEESYMPEVATEHHSGEAYRSGVRPAFYWESGKWESFEKSFNALSFARDAEAREDFAVRRKWYLAVGQTKSIIESVGEPSPSMDTRSAVQRVVRGLEAVPETSRTLDFSGWYDIPVQPPIPLSTLREYKRMSPLPNWENFEEQDVPSDVVASAYREVLKQRESWYVDSQVPIVSNHESTEIQSYLDTASKTAVETERVNLYRFDRVSEYELYGDPLVCEDQITLETWVLGNGLTLISVGD